MIGKTKAPPVSDIVLLSHLRWIAALVVAFSHIRQSVLVDYPQLNIHGPLIKLLYWIAGYGHAGVIVFFVLSGFLVGGKAIDLAKSTTVHEGWKIFFLDRFVRIFIVLWPALLLDFLVILLLANFVPTAPFFHDPHWGWDLQSPISMDMLISKWVGGALLLNQLLTSTLISDSPLWSLSYEWFYYMAALSAVLIYRRVFSWAAILFNLYFMALLLLSLLYNHNILWLGVVWVLGALANVASKHQVIRGPVIQFMLVVFVLCVIIADRVYPISDLILGFSLSLMVAHSGWSSWRLGSHFANNLASFSYSLYVTHFPILLLSMSVMFYCGQLDVRRQSTNYSLAIVSLILIFCLMFAKFFAHFTEYKTRSLKKIIQKSIKSENQRYRSKRIISR